MPGRESHIARARRVKQGSCVFRGRRETPKPPRCKPWRTTPACLTRLSRQPGLRCTQGQITRSQLKHMALRLLPGGIRLKQGFGNPTWESFGCSAKQSAELHRTLVVVPFLTYQSLRFSTICFFFILRVSLLDNRSDDLFFF